MTWNSSRDGPAPPARLRIWADDGWLAVAAPLLVFAGHALYGAALPQTALMLTTLFALLVAACLWRPRLRKDLLRLDGLALPAILFGLVILAGLWSLTPLVPGGPHPVWAYLKISPGAATVDRSATLLELIKLLGLGCIFVVGLVLGASDARSRLTLNVLLALAALLGSWAFLTLITGGQPDSNRMEASFQSANTAGTVFAAAFVLAFGPLISRLGAPPRQRSMGVAIYGAAAMLFLTCVFATASRGAFVAASAGLLALGLAMVFGGRLKWSRAALSGIAATVVVFILLALSGDLLLNRLIGGRHEIASRTETLRVHWQAFADSPLFGYGLGTFDTVNRVMLNTENFRGIWTVRAAHNVYLAWLEQGGLIGAVPMFACVAAVMVTTFRKTLRRSRMTSVLFALLAVDVVFLAHGASDFALEMFSVAAMWSLLLGLQLGLSQGSSAR